MKPHAAMVFAAGFGTRLGDLVKDRPKPLIEVAGRPLIDHALEIVKTAGVEHCAVNLHYLADQLRAQLKDRPGLTLVHEFPDILDTGGGLLNAVDIVGEGAVFTLNSDTVFRGTNPLLQLKAFWNPTQMDALLLLSAPESAIGHTGHGDFTWSEDNRIRRCEKGENGYVYTGAQIIDTRCLSSVGKRVFSFNQVWNRLISDGRLAGVLYPGKIGDAGTPEGIRASETLLTS